MEHQQWDWSVFKLILKLRRWLSVIRREEIIPCQCLASMPSLLIRKRLRSQPFP